MKIKAAGKLRHRISIQEPDLTKNNLGQIDKSKWIEFSSRMAQWTELSGRELERARQVHAEATIAVLIRYLPGVTTNMRVVFRDRVAFIAASIDEDGRQETLTLFCTEHKS